MSEQDLGQTASERLTLNSRGYKLVKKLGEGSYAKVYLSLYNPVKSTSTNQKMQLACKIIDTSRAPRDFVRKFLPRELDILVRLNHPHIIHVHSIFQRRAKYFIFMRYAENGDLLEFIVRNGMVVESQARVWMRQISLAVQYLHSMQIAHRDLKCENILITSNYNVKVADFGFARFVIDSKGRRVLSETYCGSLSYAAPEILHGSPYNPKKADLWSLGVVLYVMFNKAMPFDDSNLKTLYEHQMSRKWKFRAKVESVISDQARKVVVMLLEPDVLKRANINNVLNSDWIAMDPRLLVMTQAEKIAAANAMEERQKFKRIDSKPQTSSMKENTWQYKPLTKRDKLGIESSVLEVKELSRLIKD